MPESKSISGKAQTTGYLAEANVIKLLQSKKWILCFQGLKTDIAEIDLIFEKSNEVILIEVKTLNNSWRAFERIHKKQLFKLQSNRVVFSQKFRRYKFRAYVAWVDKQNRVSFVDV
ncbi:MAG: YraN family protein [Bdellovibrionota bacterium]